MLKIDVPSEQALYDMWVFTFTGLLVTVPQSGGIVLMTEAMCLIRSMQPPEMNVKRDDKGDKVVHP